MTTTDAPSPPLPDSAGALMQQTFLRWGDTVVGTAVAAEEITSSLVTGLLRAAGRRARREAAQLAGRGAARRAIWSERAERSAGTLVAAVAASPVVDAVVDHQLERILRPVVRAVLDDVLLVLEREPDRIRTLVRGQRESMVDEVVGRLRAGAETGDAALDRVVLSIFRRRPRTEPPPPAP